MRPRQSGDRSERLRARADADLAKWPKHSVWVIRQWWIWIVASVALALSALGDLGASEKDVRTDAVIALVISGALLLFGVLGFVSRRRTAARTRKP